jgi:hypothetical protein
MQEVVIKLTLDQVNMIKQALSIAGMKVQTDWNILGVTIESQAQAQVQSVTEGVPPAPKA